MGQPEVLAYYARHSPITDPGRHAALFDRLPRDIPGLAAVVAGLLMHPAGTQLYGEPPEPTNRGDGIRSVADTLAHLQHLNAAPLTLAREPRQRMRANCRNFAVLLVAMLRHQGVPARKRVGFASYLPGPDNYIHEIAEYWDADRGRWALVDPDNDDVSRAAQREYFAAIGQPERADFDAFDIRAEASFHLGGAVWRACRAGEADPDRFWDGLGSGLPGVRVTVLQDLDALNKAELLSWDSWHELMEKPDAELTADDVAWLDAVADLTLGVDERFDEMRERYAAAPYGQAIRSTLSALGLAPR